MSNDMMGADLIYGGSDGGSEMIASPMVGQESIGLDDLISNGRMSVQDSKDDLVKPLMAVDHPLLPCKEAITVFDLELLPDSVKTSREV